MGVKDKKEYQTRGREILERLKKERLKVRNKDKRIEGKGI